MGKHSQKADDRNQEIPWVRPRCQQSGNDIDKGGSVLICLVTPLLCDPTSRRSALWVVRRLVLKAADYWVAGGSGFIFLAQLISTTEKNILCDVLGLVPSCAVYWVMSWWYLPLFVPRTSVSTQASHIPSFVRVFKIFRGHRLSNFWTLSNIL